jgi:hypothetical protein
VNVTIGVPLGRQLVIAASAVLQAGTHQIAFIDHGQGYLGIGFMLNGNLVVAASRRGLLLRVGKDRQSAALAHSGARQMVMRGRTMEGYVYVDPPALSPQAVLNWTQLAVAHVQTLPPKANSKTKQRKGKQK